METYLMKIRDEFIDTIRCGSKKREYRLCDETRSSIRIGDILVLISKTNPTHWIRVEVAGITSYPGWEEPLTVHWKEDFSSLYPTYEAALNECRRFYEKSEVDRYGIVVFDIHPIQMPSLKKACVLLDTNIVIQRESYNSLSKETIELFKWLDKLRSSKNLHPSIRDEINKNSNETSRNGLLIKLAAYTFIDPAKASSRFFDSVMDFYSKDENSLIDNKLLLEVYLNRVDLLITNDKEMLRKASSLYIKDRVFSVGEYLDLAERSFPALVNYRVLRIKQEHFGDCDLDSPFFITLRQDYNFTIKNEFDDWFKRKTKEGGTAYVYRDQNEIKGFLYLKTERPGEEDYHDIHPQLSPKLRLKVGTFKNVAKGLRVGERFLKIIFDNALKQRVEEVYVTLFENHREEIDALCRFLKEWGFTFWGKKDDGETVLVKDMKNYNPARDGKFNFPLTKPDANYFFLPINSEYHTDLFPDYILSNEDVSFYSEGEMAHRYALEKVYVSGKSMYTVKAKPGDIVVIYRNGDRWPKKYSSVITGTVVIENMDAPGTLEDYLGECKNVSVFTTEQLIDFYNNKKYRTVLRLIQLESFETKITANFLQEKGIIEVSGGARPLQPMTSEQFRLIIDKARSGKLARG